MQSKHKWHNHLKHDIFLLLLVLALFFGTMFAEAQADVAATLLVKNTIKKFLPAPLGDLYNFASDPSSAVTDQVLSQLSQLSPEAVQSIQAAQDPTSTAKGLAQAEVLKQLSPSSRLVIQNAQEYGTYAKIAIQPDPDAPPEEQLGQMDCDYETKACSIKNPDGSTFMEVPKGVALSQEKGGILVLENLEGTSDKIKVGDFELSNVPKGGKLRFVQSDTGAEVLDVEGDIIIGGKTFTGVQDGNFKVSRSKDGTLNQLEFAEFTASEPNKFDFAYTFASGQKKDFSFTTTQPDSKVLFDPQVGRAEIENVDFDDGKNSFISDKAAFALDDSGVTEISFTGNSKFENIDQGVEVSSDQPFKVFIGKDIPVAELGNAFSLQETDDQFMYQSRGSLAYRVRDTELAGTGETLMTVSKIPEQKLQAVNLEVRTGKFKVKKGPVSFTVDDKGMVKIDKDSLFQEPVEAISRTDHLTVRTATRDLELTPTGAMTDGKSVLVNEPIVAQTDLTGCYCVGSSCTKG